MFRIHLNLLATSIKGSQQLIRGKTLLERWKTFLKEEYNAV